MDLVNGVQKQIAPRVIWSQLGGERAEMPSVQEDKMRPGEQISEFIREGLVQGSPPEVIRAGLDQAGWSRTEIDEAMGGWLSLPGLPPVPRPRPYVSARDALLYGLLFVSVGLLIWHIGVIGFELIERLLPHDGAWRSYGSTSRLRWSIAALITFGPLFFALNFYANRQTKANPGRRRSRVRKWFASATLMIVAMTLLGDLAVTVYRLLDGALTMQFGAKALLIAVLGLLAGLYYRDELDA